MVLSSFAFPAPRWLAWLRPAALRRPMLGARPNVTRWFALGLAAGATKEVPPATGRMVLHCRSGEVWITHDGESRDIVLRAGESHAVDSPRRLRVHGMAPASLEVQLDAA
jgi:hypothetical protein